MATIKDLLQELEMETHTTRRVLERVPDDRLDWQPHEKSMTLGQLAQHVASLPGAIAEISMQPKFDISVQHPRPVATSTAEILSTHDWSVGRAKELLGSMDDASLSIPWKLVDGEQEVMTITRGAVLRTILFNHTYHHRGQLTVYLRQCSVPVPAIYGPSADERPFGR